MRRLDRIETCYSINLRGQNKIQQLWNRNPKFWLDFSPDCATPHCIEKLHRVCKVQRLIVFALLYVTVTPTPCMFIYCAIAPETSLAFQSFLLFPHKSSYHFYSSEKQVSSYVAHCLTINTNMQLHTTFTAHGSNRQVLLLSCFFWQL